MGFDIIYALQDHEFDRQHGLRSLVVRWGVLNALSAVLSVAHDHVGYIGGVRVAGGISRGVLGGADFYFGCLLLEHWLARRRSLKWINTRFSASTPSSASCFWL
jgi:4-hydroxybenzoate polyprenyltransferase